MRTKVAEYLAIRQDYHDLGSRAYLQAGPMGPLLNKQATDHQGPPTSAPGGSGRLCELPT